MSAVHEIGEISVIKSSKVTEARMKVVSGATFYAKIVEMIGDLKPDQALKIPLSSSSVRYKIKQEVAKQFPEVARDLCYYQSASDDYKFLYITFKKTVLKK